MSTLPYFQVHSQVYVHMFKLRTVSMKMHQLFLIMTENTTDTMNYSIFAKARLLLDHVQSFVSYVINAACLLSTMGIALCYLRKFHQ